MPGPTDENSASHVVAALVGLATNIRDRTTTQEEALDLSIDYVVKAFDDLRAIDEQEASRGMTTLMGLDLPLATMIAERGVALHSQKEA